MERILALDIGDRRIGVAISDPFNTYALPSETYNRKNLKEDIKYFTNVVLQKEVGIIVCGLPLNIDGTRSIQTEKTERFINELNVALQNYNVRIETADERLTTVEAHKTLKEQNGLNAKQRKSCVDAMAAAEILNSYLLELKRKEK